MTHSVTRQVRTVGPFVAGLLVMAAGPILFSANNPGMALVFAGVGALIVATGQRQLMTSNGHPAGLIAWWVLQLCGYAAIVAGFLIDF